MIGGTGLRGPAKLPSIARRQWSASPALSRSISSFRSPASRFPTQYGLRSQFLAGKLSWRRPLPVAGSASARFNSTSTGTSAAPQSPSDHTPDPTPGSESTDLSDLSNVDVSSIPERIGYLKDLGLDYGWGPTAVMQYVIEHIHIWTGAPWWVSIVGAGILIRILLLKPQMMAMDNGAKMQNIKHLTAPLNEKMFAAQAKDSTEGVLQARQELTALHKQHGIKVYKSFIPLLQAPFGYGVFRGVRGMAALPVPGLTNESVLWLNDLTIADPYYALPAIASLLLYCSIKKGGESGQVALQGTSAWKLIVVLIPAVSFVGMGMFPSALQLYFVGTSTFAVAQAYVLNSPSFKRWAGITMANPPAPEGDRAMNRLPRMIKVEQQSIQQQAQAAAKARQAESQSFIDRTLDSARESLDSAKKELNLFIEKNTKQAAKNADGTPAAPPRLTSEELERAANYAKHRREQEAYALQRRNLDRRQRYRSKKQ